jgi:inward rectifier potassium channel
MRRRRSRSIRVRSGRVEFLKINAARQDWRDGYHWVLSLTWPRFALFLLGGYLSINVIFATLYTIGDGIAEMTPHSFPEAFFFSIETLATVGYGHYYPATVYGHVVVTTEIMLGTVWLAVMTGLIFVRFSRPTARILFSNCVTIGKHNGKPTLSLRVANLRHTTMVETRFRVTFSRDERSLEGEDIRRFYPLTVYPDYMVRFPAAITVRHTIDQHSPLHHETLESLEKCDAFLVAAVTSIETVMAAQVQSQQDYSYSDIRWEERFVEIYEEKPDGSLQVDYGGIHKTEPVATVRS